MSLQGNHWCARWIYPPPRHAAKPKADRIVTVLDRCWRQCEHRAPDRINATLRVLAVNHPQAARNGVLRWRRAAAPATDKHAATFAGYEPLRTTRARAARHASSSAPDRAPANPAHCACTKRW